MKRLALLALVAASIACEVPPEGTGAIHGGANLNDRGNTVDGERTVHGGMSASTDGRYVILHDATTVIVNLETKVRHERAERWDRVVFGSDTEGRATAYVSRPGYDGVVAVDLETGTDKWSLLPAYYNEVGAQFFRASADGKMLLVGDVHRVFRIRTTDGDILGTSDIARFPQFAQVSPTGKLLFVVGETTWLDETSPRTPLTTVNLETGVSASVTLPNCAAPLSILPDDSRVLMSPTFCAQGASFETQSVNVSSSVDPVSIVEVTADGEPRFVRNLPGFGPVSLDRDGTTAVAYLDSTRIDASLFDDPDQVPDATADRYHLMWIDPRTERFELQPIGQDLPRFAFAEDGQSLLVDSTVVAQRRLTLFAFESSPNGVSVDFFRMSPASSMLGVIDVATRGFRGIDGPRTSLDRFVQRKGASSLVTITQGSELDGQVSVVDVASGQAQRVNQKARDLLLLPDGRVVLRRYEQEPCVTRDLVHCE